MAEPSKMGLTVNREQAALLLKGLEGLPDIDKKSVIFAATKKDLEGIVVIWDRVIKNAKLAQEERRKKKLEKSGH